MGHQVKATKDRCLTCKYCMNLTGASFVKKGMSGALVACGYILKTGNSRVFKEGKIKEGYKSGYCSCYEKGKRVDSLDNLTNHTTIVRRRKVNK